MAEAEAPPRRSGSGRSRHLAAAVTVALGVAGCAGTATVRPTLTGPSPSPSSAAQSTTAASGTPTAATLAGCAAAVDVTALRVVHRFAVSPDDLAVDPTGRIWVTAHEANLLIGLNPDGGGLTSEAVAGGPEGVAITPSGMFVAEQNLNRIVAVTPARRTLIAFANRTANAGIDGIASDPAHQRLLVPDSPTGQLFSVPLSGPATAQLLAAHLGRPVDAATDAAGDILVASESVPGLIVLTASGGRRQLGHFADLDEVVVYAGLIYVTELDRHDVVAVDPTSGASVPIAVHLPAPQGLAVTSAGTLEIADATTNTLYSMPACGVAA